MFEELLKGKKPSKELDPTYKSAKLDVLKQISKLAEEAMGEDVKGLKQVSVMAPDKEGLKEGLEKAEELIEGEESESEEEPAAMPMEVEPAALTPEEEAQLEKLLAKKKMKP